ncbi:hypothetical protein Moror_8079 [Moniliophthora roreri MCA 2997]|uniref:Uncharacterized protein n=2 Tax=Moniliophthora roreri TaxID=221103 RepID=V2XNJ5_MONRO|nr:hypothetical protein Moror_8079 [Moniliophthora roreri MCA 2997]KAI3612172.1 hypothetical protein WG66_012241 [Moniliophthora roreri]
MSFFNPIICRWGYCRQILYSDDEYTRHLICDHVRNSKKEWVKKGDLGLLRRAEEGTGHSFSTDGLMCSYPEQEIGRKPVGNSQESSGAASLPSPPDTAPKAFSPSPSPSLPDELERSYRSRSPSLAVSPVSEKASPFLFVQDEDDRASSPISHFLPLDHRRWPTTGYTTPTFAALSSSPVGSPRVSFEDIPSPSLSNLIDIGGRGTKRKRGDEAEEEFSQYSSSTESQRQVEEELTQSLGLEEDDYIHPFDQLNPVESHDLVYPPDEIQPAEFHYTNVTQPYNESDTFDSTFLVNTRDQNRRADTPFYPSQSHTLPPLPIQVQEAAAPALDDSDHVDLNADLATQIHSLPYAGPSTPLPKRVSIYQEPCYPENHTVTTQTWYMPKRKKSRSSQPNSAVSLQQSPTAESFSPDVLCHHSPSLSQSQAYTGEFPFLTQAPYSSQNCSQ